MEPLLNFIGSRICVVDQKFDVVDEERLEQNLTEPGGEIQRVHSMRCVSLAPQRVVNQHLNMDSPTLGGGQSRFFSEAVYNDRHSEGLKLTETEVQQGWPQDIQPWQDRLVQVK